MQISEQEDRLYQTGLLALEKVGGQEALKAVSQEVARKIFCQSLQKNPIDLQQSLLNPSNYSLLEDSIPRSAAVADLWKKQAEAILESKNIRTLINDIEDDPHLKIDLVNLKNLIDQIGYDSNNSITTTHYKPRHLITFGTGSGHDIDKIINAFDPLCITVVVSDWNEWASSFFYLNWSLIWNKYVADPNRRILILQTSESDTLQSYLATTNLPILDHSFLYCSPEAFEETRGLYERINDGKINRNTAYLGFVMDEYNMLYNSWLSLQKKPRIFTKKIDRKALGSAVVVGSGPSLDQCIETVRNLSNNCLIIACASSYGTLLKHGIRVDVLCLLERGEFMVDQYTKVVRENPDQKTKLISSVTTPPALQELFEDPMIYFRPALTPLCIFAEAPNQILNNEGPQTINTGVALALSIGASQIILIGVDLGVKTLDKVRTEFAVGESPRDFPDAVSANFGGEAYTNSMLQDGKIVLEALAKYSVSDSIELINSSDGIKIEGWIPVKPQELLLQKKIKPFDYYSFEQWWMTRAPYDYEQFSAKWISSRPREMVALKFREIIKLLEQDVPWYPTMMMNIFNSLKISAGSLNSQLPSRIARGQIIKLMIAIQRQCIVMADTPELIDPFLEGAKKILVKRITQLQVEIFDLFDLLESL